MILRTALAIAERNLGTTHGGTLFGKAHLSQTLVHQRKYADAEKTLLEVVQRQNYEISAREDGEHIERISYLEMLLDCYDAQDKIDDAIRVGEELREAVATIGEQGLGTKHVFGKRLAVKQKVPETRNETTFCESNSDFNQSTTSS